MKVSKLYTDLNAKDLLNILFFIIPSLKTKIKTKRMNMKELRWGEKFVTEYNDKSKSLFIRRYVTRGSLGNFDKLLSEAISIKPNWDIKVRDSVYKGENRNSVFYADEWNAPKNIVKVYNYIKSLGYIVEEEL